MANPQIKSAPVGSFGYTLSVVCVDSDNAEQDVSSYTSGIDVVSRSPDGKNTITSTGSFVTDGSTGAVSWAYDSDNNPDRPGIWEGQVVLRKAGAEAKSEIFEIMVPKSLS